MTRQNSASSRGERWRWVPGYENLYEVSDRGRVLSTERHDRRGRLVRSRILRPFFTHDGYLRVSLSKDGVRSKHRVHRLVLKAFAGAPPLGHEAHHRNRVPTDNRLANLRWVTRSHNQRGRIDRSGRRLNDSQVRFLRRNKDALDRKQWATILGVSETTIGKIIHNQRYQETI